ncbi:MAG: WYL domain-containing protein [Clostridia bacterium]|nr:WYL domain-containing protein [Clostridia bacterium]
MTKGPSARTRLVSLVEILTLYTDEYNLMSVEELCGKMKEYGYDVNRRTVLSDLKELNKLQMQIVWADARRKRFYLAGNYSESALHYILESVFTSDYLTQAERVTVLNDLRRHACVPTLDLVAETIEIISPRAERAPYSIETLHTLRVAIAENRQAALTVTVPKPGAAFETETGTETLTVNPLRITVTTSSVALTFTTADDPATPKFIHMRRILAVQQLEWPRQPYDGPTDKPLNFFNGEPSRASARRIDWLLLRFPTELAERVADQFESPVYFKRDDAEGYCLAKVNTVVDQSLLGWLILMGGRVEILRPDYARDTIAAAVRSYCAATEES